MPKLSWGKIGNTKIQYQFSFNFDSKWHSITEMDVFSYFFCDFVGDEISSQLSQDSQGYSW